MANGNLALAFGALLGGAVVVDYGVKNFKNGFGNSSSSGAAGSSSSTSTPVSGSVTKSPLYTGKVVAPGGVSKDWSNYTAAQQAFATELSKETGLDINVVLAWMRAEQPPGSAKAPNGDNNWLNIGSTDEGFYGGENPAWTNPITAADQTASWLQGGATVGYGKASAGIRSILPESIGASGQEQIAAIQSSGWASGGYPLIQEIYNDVVNGL